MHAISIISSTEMWNDAHRWHSVLLSNERIEAISQCLWKNGHPVPEWLNDPSRPGEWFCEALASGVRYWMTDPNYAFEFKLRFA